MGVDAGVAWLARLVILLVVLVALPEPTLSPLPSATAAPDPVVLGLIRNTGLAAVIVVVRLVVAGHMVVTVPVLWALVLLVLVVVMLPDVCSSARVVVVLARIFTLLVVLVLLELLATIVARSKLEPVVTLVEEETVFGLIELMVNVVAGQGIGQLPCPPLWSSC